MATQSEQRRGTLLAILGYSVFGFSLLFSSNALKMTTPYVLLAARFLVAFILLNIFQVFKSCRLHLKGKNILPLLLLGLVQPIIYFLCENFSVTYLSTSLIGVILSLCPVLSILFGFLFLREKVSKARIFCIIASVIGVILTTLGGESGGGVSVIGLILALGAVFAATGFNLISRKIKDDFSAYEKTYIMFALGSVVFTILAIIMSYGNYKELVITPLSSIDFWIDVLYLGGISSIGGFFSINYSYSKLPIARVTVFTSLTTLFATLAGIVFLKEPFGTLKIVGAIIVIISVTLAGVFQYVEDKRERIESV